MVTVVDDGTLDTVIQCSDCKHTERYVSYAGELQDSADAPMNYEQHLRNCKEDFLNDHECPVAVVRSDDAGEK